MGYTHKYSRSTKQSINKNTGGRTRTNTDTVRKKGVVKKGNGDEASEL